MPYYLFSHWIQSVNYFSQMHNSLILNIILCKILIIKNCMTDVIVYEYQIPQPLPWEFLWAANTLIWHLLGAFAMANWDRSMLKVYIYANPFVTLTPLLIAGIRNSVNIKASSIELLLQESKDLPLVIFWSVFFGSTLAAQVHFFYSGYYFIKLSTTRNY